MILPALSLVLALSAPAADSADKDRAHALFLSGYEAFRQGRFEDARKAWTDCLAADEKHDFCGFGVSVLDAGSAKADEYEAPVTAAPPPAADDESSAVGPERASNQAYLEGVIYYQKGDYEKALTSWRRAKELAPKDSDAERSALAGLNKLYLLYGKGEEPEGLTLKEPETPVQKKDEHEALQVYFTGLIHYQKGDFVRARKEWERAKRIAPEGGEAMNDAKEGLRKLDLDEASTGGSRKK